MSDIFYDAQKIVADNGFSDVITLIKGRRRSAKCMIERYTFAS